MRTHLRAPRFGGRAHLFRVVLTAAIALTLAAPVLAQSVVRGKVLDPTGKPAVGATVLFERQDMNQKAQTKTDRNGDFLQVGLASGEWKATASMEGFGPSSLTFPVKQGQNAPMTLNLTAAAGASSAATGLGTAKDKEAAQALQTMAAAAIAAMKAGDNDGAIKGFTEVVTKVPTCSDCYYNIAVAHTNKKEYTEAEAAYKKVIELNPNSAEAYTGLANIYNAQRKFDLAGEASASAAKLSGGAAGGGSAEALYNQGVILFNSQKFPEARAQFESAVKADPTMAMAHYQLGMTALNVGDFNLAVSSLETYLKLEPNGSKAAEVKASLPALQGMVKK